ncbi:MAG TPA: alpha/beta hydrolase [Anaerolineaceae bacterium]
MVEDKALVVSGAPLEQARAAVILVHGRGATARSMIPLAEEIGLPGVAYLAPQAPGNIWYPYSLLAPLEQNEPRLSRALQTLADLFERVEAANIPAARTLLLGFSQGASLSLEFTARNPRAFGGVVGLSGALIGPPGMPRAYPGSLAGAEVFLGCSDVDPFIPLERVRETERVLRGMGAQVTARIYPGMDHTVNEDELATVRDMVERLLAKQITKG